MTVETEDKLANARSSALASYASIKEMVEAIEQARKAEDGENPFDPESPEGRAWDNGDRSSIGALSVEEAERAIHEDALSVEVRSGWYTLDANADKAPAEYRILLSWGGPAVQIRGELDEHGEPTTGRLQCQDWGMPWTDVRWGDLGDTNAEDILLTFARCFYFGEG
jgi:hypothetical protein